MKIIMSLLIASIPLISFAEQHIVSAAADGDVASWAVGDAVAGSFGDDKNMVVEGFSFMGTTADAGVSDAVAKESCFKAFPNPVDRMLTIENAEAGEYAFTFYNAAGAAVLSGNGADAVQTVDCSGLQSGTYILSVSNDNGKESFLIIKK